MDAIPVPEPLQPYMPLIIGLVTALLIFVVGWMVAKWTHNGVTRLMRRRHLDEALARFLGSMAQYLVLAATVIAALGHVGVETTSLIALLGTAGLAIGLALQGSLAHFASGVMLLVFRPFTIGDYVEAGGQSGTIEEVGLFATTLTTLENQRVTVPNGTITSGPITNYTILGKRRATIDVGVAYGTDIEVATQLLLEAARDSELVLTDPAPAAVFVNLGASSLDFSVYVWSNNADFGGAKHATRKAIYDRLNAAGIDLPFSQIVVHQAPSAT
ncbi:mechanosensitive ion channel family protein [Enhygromyxa salina]|nr:mechanosensitive ion channel domain-containing protein [Enhygromyxa salina]